MLKAWRLGKDPGLLAKYSPTHPLITVGRRELNQMLKAWEAMRLGKDAQIASLMEKVKRHEEDGAEKARTVEALRRKLAAVGRATDSSM